MAKTLRIVLVTIGIMIMVATWGGAAAGAQEIDVAVIRARQGQYLVVARDGEPRVDVAVIRARLGQYLETAWGGEPRIGEAFVRSVALTGQSPAGQVAASGPVIGQSIFPGEAVARDLLGQYLETAMGSEPQVDVAVIRARQGQYREAARGDELRLDVIVVRARQSQYREAVLGGR